MRFRYYFRGYRRFFKNRKRKFLLWLSELFLDSEYILDGTPKRNWFWKRLGMEIGENCKIDSGLWADWSRVKIGNNVLIRENCRIWGGAVIEDNVVLSAGVQLLTAGHNPSDMSVVFAPIIIHKKAWIATNAIILSGVEIGEGACVAAGSVVTKNVPPYTMVAGIPAKVVKYLKSEKNK